LELIKVEADHSASAPALLLPAVAGVAVFIPGVCWTIPLERVAPSPVGVAHAPPGPDVPLYQLFSALRFYDDGEPLLA